MNKEPSSVALIKYIKQSNDISEREKVLSALSGYWLPFAVKADGNYSEQEVKQSARNAIYKLNLHITYLFEVFLQENIPVNNLTPNIPVQSMVQQVVSNVPVSNVAMDTENIKPENPDVDILPDELIEAEQPREGVDFLPYQHDNLVETMF
ncbi:hypothetical protein [Anabaena sp. UHCC 0399]|uniref:hypothetical protein n=1 Tax=Anabaena sp. UHCC 0399 TaxID=3110238 RepID=UPI002B206D56|nr:hypothetical protein [Anabaena sp. UHCC 0399]MEA5566647.1 hypothetical protein [Anabaena sp. UHCC 0399]